MLPQLQLLRPAIVVLNSQSTVDNKLPVLLGIAEKCPQ